MIENKEQPCNTTKPIKSKKGQRKKMAADGILTVSVCVLSVVGVIGVIKSWPYVPKSIAVLTTAALCTAVSLIAFFVSGCIGNKSKNN